MRPSSEGTAPYGAAHVSLALSARDRARVEEVEQLARSGAAGLPTLVGLLDDPSWAVRRAVVAALARLGDDAIAPLCAILRTGRDNEARLAATVDALVASRSDVSAAMLRLLDEPQPPTICDALQVLGRRKETHALARIASLAMHSDDNVAVAAIEAMGRMAGASAVEPLVAAVKTRNFFRTFPALDALGRTRDQRAVDPLVALLEDPLYATEATRALGRTGQPAAVTALGPVLLRPADSTVRIAAAALTDLHDTFEASYADPRRFAELLRASVSPSSASMRLIRSLGSASPSEQIAIARVLGWLRDENGVVQLVELLDREAVAAAAASALRDMGEHATPYLLAALRTGTSARRMQVLPLVGYSAAAVEELVACLEDPDRTVRALACEALARAGNASVVPALFRLIGDPDARVSQAASGAIQALGSLETRQLALAEARSNDSRARRAAIRIVSYFGYTEGLDVLVEAMSDPDERIREAAIGGLPLVEDDRAIAALVAGAAHENHKTRAACVRALGSTQPDERVVRVLGAALDDPDSWVRYYACQSLAKLRVTQAASAVVKRIDDPAGHVRVAAVEAAAHLRTPEGLGALVRATESTDPDLRRAAIIGLGVARQADTIPILRAAATSDDAATRLVAISALAEFDVPEVVPSLAHAASDPSESVRAAAIGFLSTRAGDAATRALIDQLGNEVVRDRVIAAIAVAPEGRTEVVLSALEQADATLAALLVASLVRMRRPSSSAAIAAALSFTNVHARRAAARALAALGTAEALEALKRCAAVDLDPEVRHIGVAVAQNE